MSAMAWELKQLWFVPNLGIPCRLSLFILLLNLSVIHLGQREKIDVSAYGGSAQSPYPGNSPIYADVCAHNVVRIPQEWNEMGQRLVPFGILNKRNSRLFRLIKSPALLKKSI
uniref:Uncharacterized protein n=1 Tax=Micrurus paraensis TaxID=1970185 RepID=A0A2D4KMR3_9SAUR